MRVANNNLKVIFFYWLLVIIYAGFIFFLSSLPGFQGPGIIYLDKFLHLVEYLIFGILLSLALLKSFPRERRIKHYSLVIVLCCLYGVSDEVHQLFVVGREFSIYDIFADTLGGSLGAFFYKVRFT